MIHKHESGIRRKSTVMAAALFYTVAIALLTCPAKATELAVLRNGFSIRHEHRLVMGTTTRLFLGADDSSFTDVPTAEITGYEKDLTSPLPVTLGSHLTMQASPGAPKLGSVNPVPANPLPVKSVPAEAPIGVNEVVNSASATFHLDPDLVNSVIHAESGFNSHAISPKGARGLMQLMPRTAGQLGVNDAFDPQANVAGGSRYLRELLERYNFDLVKALAAYNAGPERVDQYQGVPPFRETRAYVARIVHEYNTKKIAQEKEARRKQPAAKAASKSPSHTAHAAKPAAAVIASESSH
jgi:soluble lytic murein transglycosylase-like protein